MAAAHEPDTLTKTVLFLQKRDGVDKVLKLLRYAAKFSLVSALDGSDTPLAAQLRSLEASIGTTRKALKLGKFLSDVEKLRKLSTSSRTWGLQLAAAGGEAVYLFLEQVTWLIKAGVVAKRHSPRVTRLSAMAELVSYTGSLVLSATQLLLSYHEEAALRRRRLRLPQSTGEKEGKQEEVQLWQQLAALRFRRTLRMLAIVQDLADAALAANDLRDGKSRLSNPVFLSLLGLLSAAISAHKNWPR